MNAPREATMPAPGIATPIPETTFGGLCSICENAMHCTFPRQAERPVMQCDEYEDLIEERLTQALQAPRLRLVTEPAPEDEASDRTRGLCRTCEHRETCTYPRPESGVWRCEEFA